MFGIGTRKDRRNPIGWIDQHGRAGRQSVQLSHLVFWFAFGSALISAVLPPFRYFYLLTPFMVIMALLADGRGRMPEEIRMYVVILLGGLLISPLSSKEGFRDLFLVFAGISVGFLGSVPKVSLRAIVLSCLIGTLAFFAFFGDFKAFLRSFSFMGSQSVIESATAFYMGAFSVFALYRRQWLLYALCLVGTIIFLKRIALLGALAVTVIYFMGEKRTRWLLSPLPMIIANLAIVALTMAYALGYFDYVIQHYTNYSANALGQGRQTFLRAPSQEILDQWYRFIFIGKGAGAVYELTSLSMLTDAGVKINLHSDLVKIVYEYGFIWFMVVIGVMYSVKGYRAKLIAVFINVLLVTDNSLIYYLLIFYIVMCARVDPEDPPDRAASLR